MAEVKVPLVLTAEQSATVSKLAMTMRLAAIVLLVVGALNVVYGVMNLLSWGSLVSIIVGAVTVLMALMLFASAADMRYMVRTEYASIHLANGFQDLAALYKSQFGLALFLILVTVLTVAFR